MYWDRQIEAPWAGVTTWWPSIRQGLGARLVIRTPRRSIRYQEGFVSSNFHVSADRTQIVNYGQWKRREALGNMGQDPAIVTFLQETTHFAGASAPAPFQLLRVFQSPPASQGSTTALVPDNGQLTLLNTYQVRPERADELVDFLSRATQDTLRYIPGFLSANLHLSFDRKKIVNYAQWTNAEATALARHDPRVAELMREQMEIAEDFAPVPLSLRTSVHAVADESDHSPLKSASGQQSNA